MKRRIIKQGRNTLTMTLPCHWTKLHNLKVGDELDVLEKGSTLLVNGENGPQEKCAVIDITNFTIPLIWRFFQGAYRSGCGEIRILFDPSQKMCADAFHYYTTQFEYSRLGEQVPPKPAIAMIQGLVDRFIGMGIIEAGKNYCIIREMGEPTPKEFDHSLRRVFLVVLQMFERVIEAAEKDEIGDSALCKEIHTIDLNVDKLVDYCCRTLNRVDSHPDNKKMLLFSTLFLLELLGDEFKYMGKHLALANTPVRETLPLAHMVKSHFELYYSLFFKFSRETAIKVGESDFMVYQKHFTMKKELRGHSRSLARHLMMISKLTFVLAELRIEMEF